MDRTATSLHPELANELVRIVEHAWPDVVLRDYRPSVLRRRVESRMAVLSISSAEEYLARVATDPAEIDALSKHLLIQTSAFFRNRDVFAKLRPLVASMHAASPRRQLRGWSAGCARGEEAYSLAYLSPALAVLGTDVDDRALDAARSATYPRWAADPLDGGERTQLFGLQSERKTAEPLQLRPPACAVRFERHDLLRATEPPSGSPFDVVLCRNVLIYFVPTAQARVQELLARAVRSGGIVCLGEAETLTRNVADQFRVLDAKARLFQKR